MSAIHVRPAPLIAMAGLALGSLMLVTWHQLNLPSNPTDPQQQLPQKFAKQVDLLFMDQADGGVLVQRSADAALLAHIPMGEGGFVRATLRSLIREHPGTELIAQRQSVSSVPDPAGARHHFRLAMTEQGQLLLWHPLSGRVLDLKAYGPSNRQAFLEFLLVSESTP
jgi:putative photosynthetic complex assembly protein